MIDLSKLKKAQAQVEVSPSDNIFSELGNNTYDFKDLISELIDNSIAARDESKKLSISIILQVDKEYKPKKFIIRDNASGIPTKIFGNAISPAAIQTKDSLNEHGLGMKQAVAAMGNLEYLVTKTKDDNAARLIKEFKYGKVDIYNVQFDMESGTEICIRDLKSIVQTKPSSITRSLEPYLGARYRRFLKPDNKILELDIYINCESTGETQYEWNIKEVKPTYFHPSTRENRPVILRYPISGSGWKAELTFGYAPKGDDEYSELGVEVPNKFHPYKVSLTRQGLDVILHDRVILFHQLSELGIINAKHNDYNVIRGEIDLIKGFSTAITKNSIIYDKNFGECIDEISKILNGEVEGPQGKTKDYLKTKTYPEEIPEKLLRDRLKKWLLDNPIDKKTNVYTEYVIEGIEGYIDILADGEAWEIKVDEANALSVYQLFMYMDIGNIQKGHLVARKFSTGAEVAAENINKNHSKKINLDNRESFPINHHPSDRERDDYY